MNEFTTEPSQIVTNSKAVALSLEGVEKSFGRTYMAVKIDSLRVKPGEFVTLVGPSGCGKTTTMRMIAGLEDPTGGQILFDGSPVNGLAVQKRNIAMVFQNYALYPHMRVADNLAYGLKKRGVPKPERDRQIAWAAKLLRIDHLLDRRPKELSGGEQQRVALGRAIIRTPNVLLLDEPLSNLDAKLRTVMRGELVKLQRRIGCTTIFVTHDQLEAMTMSDRIAVMNAGRVQQFAPPAEIYDRPANKFVAGFIGSPPMNFIAGHLEQSAGRAQFIAPNLRISADVEAKGASIEAVSLGIRPENIELGADGDLPATVTLVELIGAEKYVFLDTPAGPLISRQSADLAVRIDDHVTCRLDPRKVRFFSEPDGLALPSLHARVAA